ncbi:MAG: nitrous oxide reductase accessory protein NosL [Rhodoferax sp.]
MGLRLGLVFFCVAAGVLLLGDGVRTRPLVATPEDVCLVAPPTRYDPASGIALHAARSVPPDARCPVCGMFPARAPEWAAQVIFDNGDTQFFDSPLSLYAYLQDVGHYTPGRSAKDITASYVTAVDTRDWIAASAAVYVHGSTAVGPMRGGNLPAFAQRQAAQRFARERGGVVLAASDITPELLRQLGGGTVHPH